MWPKSKFASSAPLSVEIVSANVKSVRHEVDAGQVSVSSIKGCLLTTEVKVGSSLGDSVRLSFRDIFTVADGATKVNCELKCNLKDFESALWLGKCTISLSSLSEDAQDIECVGHGLPGDNVPEMHATICVRLHKRRPSPVGSLDIVVWQGKGIDTNYPLYVVVGLMGPCPQKHRSLPRSNPQHPIFDYAVELDLLSLQGDIVIEVWTSHSIRSNRPIGQVVIPFNWLYSSGSIDSVDGVMKLKINNWFEIFPCTKCTRYNKGGKYRPLKKGLPLTTGYGLKSLEKSLGLIKLEVTLSAKNNMPLVLAIQNSFAFNSPSLEVPLEEDAGVAAVLVAAKNVVRIVNATRQPPWVLTFYEIVRWRCDPLLTWIFLCLHTYFCLFAAVWQYPMILLVYVVILGAATSAKRNYSNMRVFSNEDESSEDSKSLAEQYRDIKSKALKVEKIVEEMASTLERLNNMLSWADSVVTEVSLLALLIICLVFSYAIKIFSSNLVFFVMGLVLFTPPGAPEIISERFKAVKLFLGLTKPVEVKDTNISEALHHHLVSGMVYCQKWRDIAEPDKRHVDDTADLDALEHLNSSELSGFSVDYLELQDRESVVASTIPDRWTTRWCEIWLEPNSVMKIVLKHKTSHHNEETTALLQLKGASVEYRGSESCPVAVDMPGAHGTHHGRHSSVDPYRTSSSSVSVEKNTNLMLHLIEVSFVDEINERSSLIIGLKLKEDCIEWIDNLTVAAEAATSLPREGSLCGNIMVTKDRKKTNLVSTMKKFVWHWLSVVPDNLELQHRHICEMGRIPIYEEQIRVFPEKLVAEHLNDTTVVSKQKNKPLPWPNVLKLTVVSARSLPVKDRMFQKVTRGPIAKVIPTLFVELILKQPTGNVVYRSSYQPRARSATFRDSFVFEDIDFHGSAVLHLNIWSKKLLHKDHLVGSLELDLPSLCIEPYTTVGHKDWHAITNHMGDHVDSGNVVVDSASAAAGLHVSNSNDTAAAVQLYLQVQ